MKEEQKDKAAEIVNDAAVKELTTKAKTDIENSLKKKFGKVTKIKVTDDEDKQYVAYLRKPTLAEMDSVAYAVTKNPFQTKAGLFRTLFVGGDKELLELIEDVDYASSILHEMEKVIKVFKTETSKL